MRREAQSRSRRAMDPVDFPASPAWHTLKKWRRDWIFLWAVLLWSMVIAPSMLLRLQKFSMQSQRENARIDKLAQFSPNLASVTLHSLSAGMNATIEDSTANRVAGNRSNAVETLLGPPRPAGGWKAFPDAFRAWPRKCYREREGACAPQRCPRELAGMRGLGVGGAELPGADFLGLLAHPMEHNRISGPRRDYTGQCAIAKQHEFIYIHVMKSGGSSFHNFLRAVLCSKTKTDKKGRPECDPEVLTFSGCRKAFARYPGFFRFSFVRHPFDRAVSCWGMAMRPQFRKGEAVNFSSWAKDPSLLKTRLINMCRPSTCSSTSLRTARHWAPQAHTLLDRRGCPLADFVGLMEPTHFMRDLHMVLEWIGNTELISFLERNGFVRALFPRENSSQNRSVLDSEVQNMTPEVWLRPTKEVLVQRYREDFDAFGFDRFDPKYGDTSRPNIMSALPS